MKNNKTKIYVIALILLLVDQLVKLIVKSTLHLHQELIIIKNFFSIHYLQNKGAAFSILQDKTLLLIIIAIVYVAIMVYYIKKETFSNLSSIALGLILGGILGNLIDRIIYTKVIDYLSFSFFGYNFPVFNIADVGITVGAFLLIVYYILEEQKKTNIPCKKAWY